MKRIFIVILLILAILLPSCATDPGTKPPVREPSSSDDTVEGTFSDRTPDDDGDITAPPTAEEEPQPPTPASVLDLISGGTANCKIVCKAYDEISLGLGQSMREAVNDRYSAKIRVTTDQIETYREDTVEILIGKTNRPETAFAREEAERINDWFVGIVGNKLVIYGATDPALEAAVSYFTETFLLKNSGGQPLSSLSFRLEDNKLFTAVYRTEKMTLLGKSAAKFSITYPAGAEITEKFYAVLLQRFLREKTGYPFPVEEGIGDGSRYEIAIGAGKADSGHAKIAVAGKQIGFYGDDPMDFEDLFRCFTETVFRADLDSFDISSGDVRVLNVNPLREKTGDYRVMFHNIWGMYQTADSVFRAKMTVEYYAAYRPDIIGFNEYWIQEYAEKAIRQGLSDIGYTEARPGNFKSTQKPNLVPLFYRADRLEVVEMKWVNYDNEGNRSDDSKCATLAVFRDRETGAEFFVCVTHLSAAADDTREKQTISCRNKFENVKILQAELLKFREKYPDIPFIIGGDHNADYSDFCKDARYSLSTGYTTAGLSVKTDEQLITTYPRAGTLLKIQSLGYTHAADLAQDLVYAVSCHGYPVSDSANGVSLPGAMPNYGAGSMQNIQRGIDHTYLYHIGKISVDTYGILDHTYERAISDHCPQIMDFTVLGVRPQVISDDRAGEFSGIHLIETK